MRRRWTQRQPISSLQKSLGSLNHKVWIKIPCTFSITMLKIITNNFIILINGILLHLRSNGHNNINRMDGLNPISLLVGEGSLMGLHNIMWSRNHNNNFHLLCLCHRNNYNWHPMHHQDLLFLHSLIPTLSTKHFSMLTQLIWQVIPPIIYPP